MNDWLSAALIPDWPAPSNVRAVATTRVGGVSEGPWRGMNLGSHVGDDPDAVIANRAELSNYIGRPPRWLNQVHGTVVVDAADTSLPEVPTADAALARVAGQAVAVLTADCLPVLFCNVSGTVVASAHAGWRGLCAGVLENTVAQMAASDEIIAWMGPAIGPNAFEVGQEVRDAFVDQDLKAATAFAAGNRPEKWLADIYALARLRLAGAGVTRVFGGGFCTVSDTRFYSYRRQQDTGRMASVIWMAQ